MSYVFQPLWGRFTLTTFGFYDNSHSVSLSEMSRGFHTYLTQEPQWLEQCAYLQTFGDSGGVYHQQHSLQ